jgi:hypothetical protein
MIASTHRAQTVLPKRRVELYDKIFDLLLGTRPYAKKTPLTLTASRNKVVLQELAWKLVNAEATQFTQRQCNFWIVDVLNRCTDEAWLPEQFLAEMTDIAGMIVEKERDYYEFTHQTFQEYFAARHLREQDDGEATLRAKLTNDRWQEVIRFYASLGDATAIIQTLLDSKAENSWKLTVACIEEAREIDTNLRTRIDEFLKEAFQTLNSKGVNLSLEELSRTQLSRRLNEFISLPGSTSIAFSPDGVTWGEYRLFLEAQQANQFHSSAEVITISSEQDNQPVIGITWQDARWFCAWLSTQNNLQENGKVFDYRLPNPEELSSIVSLQDWGTLRPFTTKSDVYGNTLVVVRETLPNRYAALLNYLANGRWQEADRETYRVMRKVAGGSWSVEAIKKFPCEDLRIIDELWVKFSGGRFGFSVQKQIYIETGNPLDRKYHEDTFRKFFDAVSWGKSIYSISAPPGHLPGVEVGGRVVGVWVWCLFSRVQTCKL